MTGKEALASALQSTRGILTMYLADFSDADVLARPVGSANHTAWQLGHLINAEAHLVKAVSPNAAFPALPAGFDKQYTNDTAKSESTQGYLKKDEYLALFEKTRDASIAALNNLSDADLDKPTTGPMAKFAPKVGDQFLLVANHTLMHAGQFTVVRRKLGKPVLF